MSYSQKVYDQLADSYQKVSQERINYLSGVDSIIISQVKNKKSLLDLGSGDGVRALRIKEEAKISEITFVENSHKMAEKCRELKTGKVSESDIGAFESSKKFDVITCLWNVLGNVETYQDRVKVFKKISTLLSDKGFFYFDVLNRYNISYYGLSSVLQTYIADLFRNGKAVNKIYTKITGGQEVTYNVHYFSDKEIRETLEEAGLQIIQSYYLDYKTGKKKNHVWQGQLLYKVKKKSS